MIGRIGDIVNNKGQALVEFVLILPIFIFLLLVIIDFGIIFNEKNNLENVSLDIINLYNNGTSLEDIKKLYLKNKIVIMDEVDYYKINISKDINLITPGLSRIFGEPYTIDVERNIPYA